MSLRGIVRHVDLVDQSVCDAIVGKTRSGIGRELSSGNLIIKTSKL